MWKQEKLESQLEVIRAVKDFVIVSGGLAWHLMSPPHTERKELHDHKDVDLFVFPKDTNEVIWKLKEQGLNRYWTKYDGKSKDFIRYGGTWHKNGKWLKILIDLFSRDVPFIKIGEFRVLEPTYLLSLYGDIHLSTKCWAVQAAKILVARGISPVGRKELLEAPK